MTDQEQAKLDSLKAAMASEPSKPPVVVAPVLSSEEKEPLPPVVETKESVVEEVEETAADILKKVQAVLDEHGGLESNIGPRHDYWNLLNLYRRLLAQEKK
jgi:hypothetical protein